MIFTVISCPTHLDPGFLQSDCFISLVPLVGDVLKGQEVGVVENHLGPRTSGRGQIQGGAPHRDAWIGLGSDSGTQWDHGTPLGSLGTMGATQPEILGMAHLLACVTSPIRHRTSGSLRA